MKKITLLLVSVFMMLTSCTKDDIATDGRSGDMFRLTVGTDNGVQTRATDPAAISGYQLRYILEIYRGEARYNRIVQKTPVFDFRLVTSQDYEFLVWVDYVVDGTNDDLHYSTSDLKSIEIMGGYINNDATRDAFFGSKKVTKVAGVQELDIDCKRPFGQLNITTTDWDYAKNPTITPKKVQVAFKAAKGFNVSTGKTTNEGESATTIDFGYDQNSEMVSEATANKRQLTCDYIFAPSEGEFLVSPKITFYNAVGVAFTHTGEMLSEVPIRRNYRTNVSGNLLTRVGTVTIKVDDEWETPDIDREVPDEEIVTHDIQVDDSNYSNGNFTPAPLDLAYGATQLNWVFDNASGDFSQGVNIIFTPAFLASLEEAGIENILIDGALASGTNFTIENPDFTGTIIFGNAGDVPTPKYTLNEITINLPNGSCKLQDVIVNSMSVITKPNTFTLDENSKIIGDLTVNGGRAMIYGTVGGNIYAKGNAEVFVNNKLYATAAITKTAVSDLYGFGLNLGDMIGMDIPIIGDMFKFNLNYAGAYANFDFNNSKAGLKWNDLRNVQYSFNNGAMTATLKNDLAVSLASIDDLLNQVNAPIGELKAKLTAELVKVKTAVAKIEQVMPGPIANRLKAEVAKLEAFVNNLPSIQVNGQANIPIATYIAASDNFSIAELTNFIGKPTDTFNPSKIEAYLDGSEPLSLYMILNLFEQVETTTGNLQVSLDKVNANPNAPHNKTPQYYTLEVEPITGLYYFVPTAAFNALGTYDPKRITLPIEMGKFMFSEDMVALNFAAGVATGFEVTLVSMGIDPAMLETLMTVLNTVKPYIETVVTVLNTVNGTIENIQSYNPWKYTGGISSTAPLSKTMGVKAKFEYEPGKLLYLTK